MASFYRFCMILGLFFLAAAAPMERSESRQGQALTLEPRNTNEMGAVVGPSYTTPGAYGAHDARTGDRTSPYPPYFHPDQGR